MMSSEKLGRRIRKRRKQIGLNQADLSLDNQLLAQVFRRCGAGSHTGNKALAEPHLADPAM
jgi:hypothetical protein